MEEEKSIAMATVSKYKVCIIKALYHYISHYDNTKISTTHFLQSIHVHVFSFQSKILGFIFLDTFGEKKNEKCFEIRTRSQWRPYHFSETRYIVHIIYVRS